MKLLGSSKNGEIQMVHIFVSMVDDLRLFIEHREKVKLPNICDVIIYLHTLVARTFT